jgi:three-Cys-motif partner protein
MSQLPPPEDDGLLIPEVGWWSREKHHFLARYVDAFTTAMKGKAWSGGLHYVDLFSGAGIERIATSAQLEWGSPLIAAQARFPFKKLHLCERDPLKCQALGARVSRVRPGSDDRILCGDAHEVVTGIVREIPAKSLTLAFLDAYGLHANYESLRALSTVRADLILFFPVELDALRNWKHYYWDDPQSNLDGVLGPDSGWRDVVSNSTPAQTPVRLIELYTRQIGKLGYSHFDWEPIPSLDAPLYRLIFCSRHVAGLRIWRGIASTKPGGQRTMFND